MEIVGKSVPRVDALSKAKGKAIYVDDLEFPGMLYAGVKRSPHPHARIKKIDLSKLKKYSDVYALTYEDIPGKNLVPLIFEDWPVLAPGINKFNGEAVALVAAPRKDIVEDLLEEIDVEYEPLPAVFDPIESMNGRVKIYGENNIFTTHRIERGDIESAFKEADVVIENVYKTPYQEHAYLETQGMIAVPTPEGGMDVYGTMQCPFYVQKAVAEVLGIGLNKVRVIQTETGGGFGGKEDVPSLVAAQAALLAFISGKPVKLIYKREEDIISMSKRHPGIIKYRTAAKKDGTIVGVDVEYIIDAGAYATLSPVVLWRGTVHAAGPYKIPNVKVISHAVATNKVPCGAFRGFGSPQVLFAAELQMNMVAESLGIDPATLREKNLVKEGDEMPFGEVVRNSVGAVDTLKKAVSISNFSEKYKAYKNQGGEKRRGIGIATIFYGVGLGAGGKKLARAGAFVQVTEDGKVQFAVGTTEMGQGMKTALTQIVAEEMGVDYSDVQILPVDTSRVPDSGPTVASRATVMSGNALIEAIKPIKKKLKKIASSIVDADDEEIEFRKGKVYVKGKERASFKDVVKVAYEKREHLASQGYYVSPETSWEDGKGGKAYMVYSWSTKIAEVEVDMLTGEVTVLRIISVHDIGKAINPQMAEGQIEGGAAQGIGYALMEEIIMEEGKILNQNFSTYIIPTVKDVPEIIPIIIERPFEKGPYGAKGFGEQPLMGIAPAIANAIQNATGVFIKELPITPERLYEALVREGKIKPWSER